MKVFILLCVEFARLCMVRLWSTRSGLANFNPREGNIISKDSLRGGMRLYTQLYRKWRYLVKLESHYLQATTFIFIPSYEMRVTYLNNMRRVF